MGPVPQRADVLVGGVIIEGPVEVPSSGGDVRTGGAVHERYAGREVGDEGGRVPDHRRLRVGHGDVVDVGGRGSPQSVVDGCQGDREGPCAGIDVRGGLAGADIAVPEDPAPAVHLDCPYLCPGEGDGHRGDTRERRPGEGDGRRGVLEDPDVARLVQPGGIGPERARGIGHRVVHRVVA